MGRFFARRAHRAVVGTLAVLSLAALAGAHGGVYYGPPSSVPPGGGAAGPGVPTPTGPVSAGGVTGNGSPTANSDDSSWQLWWTLHRDTYMNLRQTLAQNAITTSDDAFFGLGGTLARTGGGRPTIEALRDRVVPVLLRALEKERNPDVLTGALLALAKIGQAGTDPEGHIRAALQRFLDNSNQEVAETAAIGLGVLGDPASTPLLASLLRGGAPAREHVGESEVPDRTRAFAAYGLGLLGARAAISDVRRYSANALCAQLEADKSASSDVRVACAIALGLVRIEPERLPVASDSLTPSASREQEIAWLSARLADAHLPELMRGHLPVALARLAHGGRPELRVTLVRSLLAYLAPHAGLPATVQQGAVTALGLLGDNDEEPLDREVLETLQRCTKEGDPLARRLAWIALARVGAREGSAGGRAEGLQRARSALYRALEIENGPIRPWVGLALGVLEHARVRAGELAAPDSVRALRSALDRHDGPAEAGAYCLALGLCHDTAVRERLEKVATRTQDDELQSQAALALGLLGDRASIEPLRRLVLEARQRPLVLRDSAIALGLLGDHELVNFLVSWLREATNVGLLSATAGALGWVGDQRALEPLCALVESSEVPDRSRAFAAVALGLLGDKDLLPWNSLIARDLNWWLAPATLYEPVTGTGVIDLL